MFTNDLNFRTGDALAVGEVLLTPDGLACDEIIHADASSAINVYARDDGGLLTWFDTPYEAGDFIRRRQPLQRRTSGDGRWRCFP